MLISVLISQIILEEKGERNVEKMIEKSLKTVLFHFKSEQERSKEWTEEEEEELLRWCFLFSKYDPKKKNVWKKLDLEEESRRGYAYKTMASALLSLRFASHKLAQIDLLSEENKTQIFVDVINSLAFEGGDADTNLAVKKKK